MSDNTNEKGLFGGGVSQDAQVFEFIERQQEAQRKEQRHQIETISKVFQAAFEDLGERLSLALQSQAKDNKSMYMSTLDAQAKETKPLYWFMGLLTLAVLVLAGAQVAYKIGNTEISADPSPVVLDKRKDAL